MKYYLKIVTPKGKFFESEEVTSIRAKCSDGYFEIMANHTPTIGELCDGVVRIKEGEKELEFSHSRGLLNFSENRAAIICEKIESYESEE